MQVWESAYQEHSTEFNCKRLPNFEAFETTFANSSPSFPYLPVIFSAAEVAEAESANLTVAIDPVRKLGLI